MLVLIVTHFLRVISNDDGVESKSEQQGEVSVSVSVRSSSSSSFASSSTGGDRLTPAPVSREDYLRMCQFHTVPWFQKPIARLYDADGKSVKRLWYLRSATIRFNVGHAVDVCLFK